MATPAQILANRENAKSSTGPVTPEGKARSAANATKHGLSSAFSVLPTEDLDEFNEMNDGYLEEFAPQGYHETFLVQQMVQARWRILRVQRLELRYLTGPSGNSDEADAAILAGMEQKGVNVLMALQRYAASAERSYYKAHRELLAGRAGEVRAKAAHVRQEKKEAEKILFDSLNALLPPYAPRQNKANSAPQNLGLQNKPNPNHHAQKQAARI